MRKVVSAYRDAYAGLPRNAWLLALVQFVNRSGSMVLFFLSLYLTRKMGFSLALGFTGLQRRQHSRV